MDFSINVSECLCVIFGMLVLPCTWQIVLCNFYCGAFTTHWRVRRKVTGWMFFFAASYLIILALYNSPMIFHDNFLHLSLTALHSYQQNPNIWYCFATKYPLTHSCLSYSVTQVYFSHHVYTYKFCMHSHSSSPKYMFSPLLPSVFYYHNSSGLHEHGQILDFLTITMP